MMLVDAPVPELRVPLATLIPGALMMAAGTTFLVRLVVSAQRLTPVTGSAGMLGQQGVADSDLAPSGWVRVMGERWRAEADARVAAGEAVVVSGIDGLRLKVRRIGQ